jgi:hypothetical protein
MMPKKLAPDSIPGVKRFSGDITLKPIEGATFAPGPSSSEAGNRGKLRGGARG